MKTKRKQLPLTFRDDRAANMTAAIYVRKSTDTEGKSKSRDEQMDCCKRYAESFGFKEVQEFVEEEGQKGQWWWRDPYRNDEGPYRPQLTKLMEAIYAGKIQAILVYKQDRLARDVGIADVLHKIFKERDIRFICNGRDSEIDSARGMYQASLESVAAAQWRETISEEICRDHDYKFKLRMFTRNPSCYGFRSAGRGSQKVNPVYEELAIVQRIYRMFLGIGCPALGPYQIANVFDKEGIVLATGSKGHKKKKFHRIEGSSVRQILKNPMYAGIWQHNGERAFYDRLLIEPEDGVGEKSTAIPDEWFHQAQAKLAAVAPTGRKASTSTKMLSGLVVCGACGRVCHPNTKNNKDGTKTYRWICPYRYGSKRSCFGPSYLTLVDKELDSWVIDRLVPFLAHEFNLMNNEGQGLELSKTKKVLELQLVDAKKKANDDLMQYMGVIDKDQFASLAQSLLNQQQDIERRLMDVNSQLGQQQIKFCDPNDLKSQDPKLLKEALKRFIRWIAMTDKGITVLTSFGTYFGARYREKNPEAYSNSSNRRSLLPPDPLSTADCLAWISNPADFIEGRREALGSAGKCLTDTELLPGAMTNIKNAA